jgi:Cd2+/Zn2+-exporting ATPase
MLAVAAGAALIGAWREGALLLFLFSASGAMEHYAMGRTRREIGALLRGAPKTALVIDEGREREVPVDDLLPGMTVRVVAGGQIPVDLTIASGQSECDESNLTGEAVPVPKSPGDTALAGTINLSGVLEGAVLRSAAESSLQRIIRLIREAQGLRAPSQTFTDRFGTTYTWTILTACTVMFFVWWLVFGLPPFASTEIAAARDNS